MGGHAAFMADAFMAGTSRQRDLTFTWVWLNPASAGGRQRGSVGRRQRASAGRRQRVKGRCRQGHGGEGRVGPLGFRVASARGGSRQSRVCF